MVGMPGKSNIIFGIISVQSMESKLACWMTSPWVLDLTAEIKRAKLEIIKYT
jgi:hypothetical protein